VRSRALVAALLIALALASGCFRTRYVNLVDPEALEPVEPSGNDPASSVIQFQVPGWMPQPRILKAAEKCRGPGDIEAIETEMTSARLKSSVLCKDKPRTRQ
jgi:hypothetical protein